MFPGAIPSFDAGHARAVLDNATASQSVPAAPSEISIAPAGGSGPLVGGGGFAVTHMAGPAAPGTDPSSAPSSPTPFRVSDLDSLMQHLRMATEPQPGQSTTPAGDVGATVANDPTRSWG